MKYKTEAVAILSQEDFDAATAAGARVEYTYYLSDPLHAPMSPSHGSRGWIDNARYADEGYDADDGKFRAFYPEETL